MQKFRNITVCVPREVYHQVRRLAAEYESPLSTLVGYLLQNIAEELRSAGYPKGGPREARRIMAERAAADAGGKEHAREPMPSTSSFENAGTEKIVENSVCETVNHTQSDDYK